MSLTPLTNIHSRISPRIFEKIRNDPNEILIGPGTLIYEKNLKSKISCQTPFKGYTSLPAMLGKTPIFSSFWPWVLSVLTSMLNFFLWASVASIMIIAGSHAPPACQAGVQRSTFIQAKTSHQENLLCISSHIKIFKSTQFFFIFQRKIFISSIKYTLFKIASDSTVSEDARIEPRTVALFALEVRRCITPLL